MTAMPHPLDNPFWTGLRDRHAGFALCAGEAARYPADIAPFLGVPHAGVDVEDAFERLVAPGEQVYLIGVAPEVPAGWHLTAHRPLAQMICERPIDAPPVADIVALDEAQRDDVLALTALVYPHYFRAGTLRLGRYFGIREGGRLAAMAGERLATAEFQEVSAICTHPDHLGRGYAAALTALLTNDILAQGRTPYLHVSHENPRAMGLYVRLGYRVRRDIAFWTLRRER